MSVNIHSTYTKISQDMIDLINYLKHIDLSKKKDDVLKKIDDLLKKIIKYLWQKVLLLRELLDISKNILKAGDTFATDISRKLTPILSGIHSYLAHILMLGGVYKFITAPNKNYVILIPLVFGLLMGMPALLSIIDPSLTPPINSGMLTLPLLSFLIMQAAFQVDKALQILGSEKAKLQAYKDHASIILIINTIAIIIYSINLTLAFTSFSVLTTSILYSTLALLQIAKLITTKKYLDHNESLPSGKSKKLIGDDYEDSTFLFSEIIKHIERITSSKDSRCKHYLWNEDSKREAKTRLLTQLAVFIKTRYYLLHEQSKEAVDAFDDKEAMDAFDERVRHNLLQAVNSNEDGEYNVTLQAIAQDYNLLFKKIAVSQKASEKPSGEKTITAESTIKLHTVDWKDDKQAVKALKAFISTQETGVFQSAFKGIGETQALYNAAITLVSCKTPKPESKTTHFMGGVANFYNDTATALSKLKRKVVPEMMIRPVTFSG